ncbi:uncharacterized protein LOC143171290 [Aptenodytes patagonicus]|uniref:uncharacterized protein LOC143171290 n=1 Tax=Aptenodytes patagonicus TaxID=9234 RepID=UPI003FA0B54D
MPLHVPAFLSLSPLSSLSLSIPLSRSLSLFNSVSHCPCPPSCSSLTLSDPLCCSLASHSHPPPSLSITLSCSPSLSFSFYPSDVCLPQPSLLHVLVFLSTSFCHSPLVLFLSLPLSCCPSLFFPPPSLCPAPCPCQSVPLFCLQSLFSPYLSFSLYLFLSAPQPFSLILFFSFCHASLFLCDPLCCSLSFLSPIICCLTCPSVSLPLSCSLSLLFIASPLCPALCPCFLLCSTSLSFSLLLSGSLSQHPAPCPSLFRSIPLSGSLSLNCFLYPSVLPPVFPCPSGLLPITVSPPPPPPPSLCLRPVTLLSLSPPTAPHLCPTPCLFSLIFSVLHPSPKFFVCISPYHCLPHRFSLYPPAQLTVPLFPSVLCPGLFPHPAAPSPSLFSSSVSVLQPSAAFSFFISLS